MAVSPVSGVVQKIIEPFNQYYNVEIYIRGPFDQEQDDHDHDVDGNIENLEFKKYRKNSSRNVPCEKIFVFNGYKSVT